MSHHLPSPAPTPSSLPISNNTPQPPSTQSQEDGPITIDQASLRERVESLILRLTQDLYELEICAGDVGAGMEDAVPNYLMKINQGFVELSNLSAQMTDSVPHQVIDNVDRSKNPHLYTKQALTRATGENQYALGRVLGLENFRRQLSSALAENFPEIPIPPRRHVPSTNDPPAADEVKSERREDMVNGDSQQGVLR